MYKQCYKPDYVHVHYKTVDMHMLRPICEIAGLDSNGRSGKDGHCRTGHCRTGLAGVDIAGLDNDGRLTDCGVFGLLDVIGKYRQIE